MLVAPASDDRREPSRYLIEHRVLARFAAVALVAGMIAGGCRTAAPPVVAEAPSFALVADDGSAFASDRLRGHAWLASFLYTSCPGPCPRLVEKLKRLRSDIPAERLAFVSFSVDPETDTPEVLRKYKAAHGIDAGDRWTFVTGPVAEVTAIVQRGFLTGLQKEDPASAEGGVSHGTRVALVDADGHVRGFYSTEDDADFQRLKRDVSALD
jgi:protein SCO1/2